LGFPSVDFEVLLTAFEKFGIKLILSIQNRKGIPDSEYIGKCFIPYDYLYFDETVKKVTYGELLKET